MELKIRFHWAGGASRASEPFDRLTATSKSSGSEPQKSEVRASEPRKVTRGFCFELFSPIEGSDGQQADIIHCPVLLSCIEKDTFDRSI